MVLPSGEIATAWMVLPCRKRTVPSRAMAPVGKRSPKLSTRGLTSAGGTCFVSAGGPSAAVLLQETAIASSSQSMRSAPDMYDLPESVGNGDVKLDLM